MLVTIRNPQILESLKRQQSFKIAKVQDSSKSQKFRLVFFLVRSPSELNCSRRLVLTFKQLHQKIIWEGQNNEGSFLFCVRWLSPSFSFVSVYLNKCISNLSPILTFSMLQNLTMFTILAFGLRPSETNRKKI